MYVTRIQSNIKGGCDLVLGPKTILVGPNASGKSSVTQAVELALTGRVSDIAGRETVAREMDLLALAPGRAGELFAHATLSDGSTCSWVAGDKGKKKATHIVPAALTSEEILPLRQLREALLGEANTARKFLISFTAGEVKEADMLAYVPEPLRPLWRKAVLSYVARGRPGIDRLLHVLEAAGTHAREAAARSKAATAIASDSGQGLPVPPTLEATAAAEEAHKATKAALEAAVAQQAQHEAGARAAQRLGMLREEYLTLVGNLIDARTTLGEAEQAFTDAQEHLASLPIPQELSEAQEAILDLLEDEETCAAPNCRLCLSPVEIGLLNTRRRVINASLTAQHAEQQVYRGVEHRVTEAEARLGAAQVQVLAATRRLDALTVEGKALKDLAGPALAPAQDLDGLRAAVESAAKLERDLHSAKVAWAQTEKAKSSSLSSEEEAHGWKQLEKACKEALGKLLISGVDALVGKVQARLPPTDHFALRLHDGKREVVQVGFERDGVLHTALSGAEWARMTAALAAACGGTSPLQILIPEERAFDPATLAEVLTGLSGVEAQVLVASPVAPAKVPNDWAVVSLPRLSMITLVS